MSDDDAQVLPATPTSDEPSLLERANRHPELVVALLALVAFLPSLTAGFVFDDNQLIADNPYAKDLRYLGRCFTTDLWDTPGRSSREGWVLFYRPLVCSSYVLNWAAAPAAWAFHAVNVALHAAAAALATALAIRWTESTRAGLLVGVIFALHPVRTETVIWVSGRTDLMMTVALLGAVALAAAAARQRGSAAALKWCAAATAWCAALLSKEFAVCVPLLLAIEWAVAREARTRRALMIAAAATALASGAYLVARAVWLPIRPEALEGMALPPLLHAAYVALSIGYYVERLVWPWPQTFHYDPIVVVDGTPHLSPFSVILGSLAVVALLAWTIRTWRRDRTCALLLLAAAAIVAPVANISYTGFPGTTADRFLYLPLLPLAAGLARSLRALAARAPGRVIALASIAVALPWLGVNWLRAADYGSEEAIWRHELDVEPNNPQALAALASELSAREPREARALLVRSLSPEATRYRLVAKPGRAYAALLTLHGPQLADCHTDALYALDDELADLLAGRMPPKRVSGDVVLAAPNDEHLFSHVRDQLGSLTVARALVASRIGRDEAVRAAADAIPDEAPLSPPVRYNLALALMRAERGARARYQLRLAERGASEAQLRAIVAARSEWSVAEKLLAQRDSELKRGAGYFRLGAYLRAARALRSAVRDGSADARTTKAYIEALVWCRDRPRALEAASQLVGDEAAEQLVRQLEGGLSARTRAALPPPNGQRWWVERERLVQPQP